MFWSLPLSRLSRDTAYTTPLWKVEMVTEAMVTRMMMIMIMMMMMMIVLKSSGYCITDLAVEVELLL
jgi:hypothetical protein